MKPSLIGYLVGFIKNSANFVYHRIFNIKTFHIRLSHTVLKEQDGYIYELFGI
tara:strand:- start:2676 stop:2834 length:159 start_codon:yes stop_codon:yes gene_type:complete